MAEVKTTAEVGQALAPSSLPPLCAADLPEGFGASWRLVPTGVRWTFLEVVRGRFQLVFVIAAAMVAAYALGAYLGLAESPIVALGSLVSGIGGLATEDEYVFAARMTGALLAIIPIIVVVGLMVALVVMVVYNVREGRTSPIPRATEVHAYDARFKRSAFLSAIAGLFFLTLIILAVDLLFALCVTLIEYLGLVPFSYNPSAESWSLPLSLVALMLAELSNRRLASLGDDNGLLVEGVAAGSYDPWLPERLRDSRGRALVARLVGSGAASSIGGAVLLVRLLDLRDSVGDISEVLGNLLDAIAAVVTVGASGWVVAAVEDAAAACAENAERGVLFGDPAFEWSSQTKGELRSRARRTVLAAAILFACIVAAQLIAWRM